jgi:glucose-6-phosphate 1-dehydrogenase
MNQMFPQSEKPEERIGFVIFGVTGDLTKRKLIPAMYQLAVEDQLPDELAIIGFARRDWDDEKMRSEMRQGVEEFSRVKPVDADALEKLLACMSYVRSTFEDADGYHRLNQVLEAKNIHNVLYYFSTPPDEYQTIVEHIGSEGMAVDESGWARVVIEKPYGHDLESAIRLDAAVHQVFKEDQIFRIDHYLGKETVQNILVFRFANGIFEPLWNRHYIDNVQISVAETVGVGSRAGYYESAGVIRDMFQNHLLQLLALTAMEAPIDFNAGAVRDEKVKVLRALEPITGKTVLDQTFRAQYVAGTIGEKRVPGYKDEPNVPDDSITETLLAARLQIESWRWAGVPFYVRSGKRLPKRVTEIAIQFKQVPLPLFNWRNTAGEFPNTLILNIQPEEGITLSVSAKKPGPINQIEPVELEFSYAETFGANPPEAYERLLLDSLNGDATLFTRSDEVETAWAFTSGIISAWEENPILNLPVYEAGTWGPDGLHDFIAEAGHCWRNL